MYKINTTVFLQENIFVYSCSSTHSITQWSTKSISWFCPTHTHTHTVSFHIKTHVELNEVEGIPEYFGEMQWNPVCDAAAPGGLRHNPGTVLSRPIQSQRWYTLNMHIGIVL